MVLHRRSTIMEWKKRELIARGVWSRDHSRESTRHVVLFELCREKFVDHRHIQQPDYQYLSRSLFLSNSTKVMDEVNLLARIQQNMSVQFRINSKVSTDEYYTGRESIVHYMAMIESVESTWEIWARTWCYSSVFSYDDRF